MILYILKNLRSHELSCCYGKPGLLMTLSHVKAEEIDILGKNNGKINLWAGKQSSLEADLIYFGRLSTPNTKAERNTTITVGKMLQA